jgi:hypothetical protein
MSREMESLNPTTLDLRCTRDILTAKHVMSDSDCQSAKNVKRASETMNRLLRHWVGNGAGAALSAQCVLLLPFVLGMGWLIVQLPFFFIRAVRDRLKIHHSSREGINLSASAVLISCSEMKFDT